MTGPTEVARSHCAEAAALVDELSDDELSRRPDAASWLAAAELYLDRYAEADAHASRALGLARATGRGDPLFRLYPILPRIWYVHGKLAAAAELLDGAIEAGRLLGSPPALAGNLFNRSVVAVAMGDVDLALATAEEGVELTRDLDHGFVAAWAAVRLASCSKPGNQPEAWSCFSAAPAGVDAHPRRLEGVLPRAAHRVFAGIGSPDRGRARSLCCRNDCSGRGSSPRERLGRSGRRRLALHTGDTAAAIQRAAVSADAAQEVGAPIESALSRTLAGRALAQEARTTAPWRSFNAPQQHSTSAVRCTTALARSENSEARPSAPSAHARRQARRGRHRLADRTPDPDSAARRRPQNQFRDRRRAVPEREDGRGPSAQHLPQDRRPDTGRACTCGHARRR